MTNQLATKTGIHTQVGLFNTEMSASLERFEAEFKACVSAAVAKAIRKIVSLTVGFMASIVGMSVPLYINTFG